MNVHSHIFPLQCNVLCEPQNTVEDMERQTTNTRISSFHSKSLFKSVCSSADGSNLPMLQKRTSTSNYFLLITAKCFSFSFSTTNISFKVHACFFFIEKSFLINILKIILSVTYRSLMLHEQHHHLIPH